MVHKHREILSNRNAIFSLCETTCGAQFKVIPLKLFYYQTFFETWRNEHS